MRTGIAIICGKQNFWDNKVRYMWHYFGKVKSTKKPVVIYLTRGIFRRRRK